MIFFLILDYLTKNVPGITIATDIICGFPYETNEDFEETLDMIKHYKFPVINISQFYSRPGTVAAKWKKVESKEVKRRSTAVYRLFLSYPNYDHLKGTIQRVWIHDLKDEGRNPDESVMVAHTKSYAKVLVNREPELIGKQVIVKIVDIHKWHVYGEIIDRSPKPIHVNFEDHFKGMYKVNKTIDSTMTKMNEIKMEQEDIHATIIMPKDKEQVDVNAKTATAIASNKADPLTFGFSDIISVTLYLLAMYSLYLGLNRTVKFNKF
jgi:hypothetical protein